MKMLVQKLEFFLDINVIVKGPSINHGRHERGSIKKSLMGEGGCSNIA